MKEKKKKNPANKLFGKFNAQETSKNGLGTTLINPFTTKYISEL